MALKRGKKFLKWLAISASVLALLWVGLYLALPSILAQVNISYTQLNFRFPSTIAMQNLRYDNESVLIESDSARVQFRWRKLFQGKLDGQFLEATNLLILIKDVPDDPTDTSTFTMDDILPIHFDKIEATQGVYRSYMGTDSIVGHVPHLFARNFTLHKGIKTDSFYCHQPNLAMAFLQPDTIPDADTSTFTFLDFYPISAGRLVLEQGRFDLYNPDAQHDFSQIEFNISGIDSENPIDLHLNKLAFSYQDTITLLATSDEFDISNDGMLQLNALNLVLPGIKINANSFAITKETDFGYQGDFKTSTINSSILKAFIADFPMAANTEISFKGGIVYANDLLQMDAFYIDLNGKNNVLANGTMATSTEAKDFNLEVQSLHTSLYQLQEIFMLEPIENQQDIAIDGHFIANGNLDNVQVSGQTTLNKTALNLTAQYLNLDNNNTEIQWQLQSPKLVPADVVSAAPQDLAFDEIFFTGQLQLDSTSIKQFAGQLDAGHFAYADYQLENLNATASANAQASEIALKDAIGKIDFEVATEQNVFEDDSIAFNGLINGIMPQITDVSKSAGKLNAPLHGAFIASQQKSKLTLVLDTMRFLPDSSTKKYVHILALDFQTDTANGYQLSLTSDTTLVIDFKAAPNAFAFLDQEELKPPYPEVSANANVTLDSILCKALLGENASLTQAHINIFTQGDTAKMALTSNYAHFNDFVAQQMAFNFSITEENYNGELDVNVFKNPYQDVENIAITVSSAQKENIVANFYAMIPQVNESVDFGLLISETKNGIAVRFAENKPVKLGKQNWEITVNEGVDINLNEGKAKSRIEGENNEQKIAVWSDYTEINGTFSAIEFGPIYRFFTSDSTMHGQLNLDAKYAKTTGEITWQGGIDKIKLDSVEIGQFSTSGHYAETGLLLNSALENKNGKLTLKLEKIAKPINFELNLHSFDLASLNTLLDHLGTGTKLSGNLTGEFAGNYTDKINAKGGLKFKDASVSLHDYGFYATIPDDSLRIVNQHISFSNFSLLDHNGKAFTLTGKVPFSPTLPIDIRAKTSEFMLFNQPNKNTNFWGKGSISADIRLHGQYDKLKIDGQLQTLEGMDVGYAYHSEVSVDKLDEEIVFVSDASKDAEKKKNIKKNLDAHSFLEWDLDVNIGTTQAYILLSEVSNDYLRMVANGQLKLRSGTTSFPLIYGKIESHSGSIFYDAPMVSDLDLKIEQASISFNGSVENPTISFRGTEIFRIAASEVYENSSSKSRIPVEVIAMVDESELDKFDLKFDLRSSNAGLSSKLASLPKETRETYAMNLLIFGSLDGNGAGSNTMMNSVVGKLNEISRRNIKSADLTFYLDSQEDDPDANFKSTAGYNFSKGMFHQKVRLTIGGEVNLDENAPVGSKQVNPLATVQLDYILTEDPELSINASKIDSYRGVIDGQVDEYSLGFTYALHFRNLFFNSKKHRQNPIKSE